MKRCNTEYEVTIL